MLHVVILAGGSGTRLWPLSQPSYPKQFLTLVEGESFLQKTVRRALRLTEESNIFIVTHARYKALVEKQVRPLSCHIRIHCEPCARNKAPAIMLAALFCRNQQMNNQNDVFVVMPSDHMIFPEEEFCQQVLHAAQAAQQKQEIVLMGVSPTSPHTGYGYIQLGDEKEGLYSALAFEEKPNAYRAMHFLSSGNYLWNAGIFVFSHQTLYESVQTYVPSFMPYLEMDFDDFIHHFPDLPNLSFDHAILEKMQGISVLPLSVQWSDIGSWQSFYEMQEKDEQENVCLGQVQATNSRRCLFVGSQKAIVAHGLQDVIVVDSENVLFLTKRSFSQKVREIADAYLKKTSKTSSS